MIGRLQSRHALLLLLVALSACAAGPDYVRPTPSAAPPKAFREAADGLSTSGPVETTWWRLYHDENLDRLIGEAFAANTDLRVAQANLARARAALDQARLAWETPQTSLAAGVTQGRSALTNFAAELDNTPPRVGTLDSASFAAAYELDLFGGARRSAEAAHAGLGVAQAGLAAAKVSVAADTAKAYAEACAYGEAEVAARGSLDIVRSERDVTRARLRLGAATDLDLARQDALLSQTEASLFQAEARRKSALYALTVLTGRSPEAVDSGAAACVRPPELDQPIPVGDGVSLIRRRPDVRLAERNLALQTAEIGVATAALYPTITLGGQISAGGANPAAATHYGNVAFGFGPALSWSFPNIAVTRSEIAQARASAKAALANFDAAVLASLKDVETALATLQGERQRNASLRDARDRLRDAYALARVQYERGGLSFLDLLDTQRSLTAAESDLAASDLSRADAETAVFRALGGGWEAAPPKP